MTESMTSQKPLGDLAVSDKVLQEGAHPDSEPFLEMDFIMALLLSSVWRVAFIDISKSP